MTASDYKVVDLFSGVGGLTHGFFLEGFDVVAGVDIDESCRYAFEQNNEATFVSKDIAQVTPEELERLYGKTTGKILIGCAPCTPFSTLNLDRAVYQKSDKKWMSLDSFRRLITKVSPEIVSMENVPDLANIERYPVFSTFLDTLTDCGYKVSYKTVDSSRYGVPQRRKRLVLLASRLGSISLIPETHDEDEVKLLDSQGVRS